MNDNSVYRKEARVEFRVVEWNFETKHGSIRDRQGADYPISAKHLAEPGVQLKRGEIVTGEYLDWQTIVNIIPERPVDLGKHIQIPIIECPEKKDVASYVEHLVNTNQLPQIPAKPNEPWCVQGSVLRNGIYWSVVLVPAATGNDGERANFDSVGPNPEGDAIAQELGRRLHGGKPQRFGNPGTGRFSDGRE